LTFTIGYAIVLSVSICGNNLLVFIAHCYINLLGGNMKESIKSGWARFTAWLRARLGVALTSEVAAARTEGIELVKNNPGQFHFTTRDEVLAEVGSNPAAFHLVTPGQITTIVTNLPDLLAAAEAEAAEERKNAELKAEEARVLLAEANRLAASSDSKQSAVNAFRTASS
jgi:hypothetical protein